MYTFRDALDMGMTGLSKSEVMPAARAHQPLAHASRAATRSAPPSCSQILDILQRLRAEWRGADYELLSHNCCHFAEQLCVALGVAPVPGVWGAVCVGSSGCVFMASIMHPFPALASAAAGWLNRVAYSADATRTWSRNTMEAVSPGHSMLASTLLQRCVGVCQHTQHAAPALLDATGTQDGQHGVQHGCQQLRVAAQLHLRPAATVAAAGAGCTQQPHAATSCHL